MAGTRGRSRARKRSTPHVEKENEHAEKKPKSEASQTLVGSGRLAAQGISYSETKTFNATKDDLVKVTEIPACDTEVEALEQTGGLGTSERRLYDFEFCDERGELQPLEVLENSKTPLSITATIHPADGPISKSTARSVKAVGPIEKWDISYSKTEAKVRVWTGRAMYVCHRPGSKYKKIFAEIMGQAEICQQVIGVLNPERDGNIDASFEEVLVKLARSKVHHDYGTWRDAVLLNRTFILKQLRSVTEKTGMQNVKFEESKFAVTLEAEGCSDQCMTVGGGINIPGGAGNSSALGDAQLTADEEFARRLQAKEEARFQQGGNNGRRGKSQAYIQISEVEIADDYPIPTQYEKEEDEMDELVMADEEVFYLAPEDLPQRILTDFAIYNSEGFFASLELVPSWSGLDPDVALYGSGTVKEEEDDLPTIAGTSSEFQAGGSSSGAGGSSSGAGGSSSMPVKEASPGIRIFLSQIKEWIVECGFDSTTISMRTDVCWYKLENPTPQYKPWFDVALKCASVAVKIIGLVSQEARASRLSFQGIIQRLAEQAKDDPAYISKNAAGVQRFVTVHGQIILNQFKNYPVEAIKKSAFPNALKIEMEMRRHCKLYMPKKKKTTSRVVVNRNPMKDRVAKNIRAKSMAATATQLVQSIWQNYFMLPGAERKDPAAQEDVLEEDVTDEEDLGQETDLTEAVQAEQKTEKNRARVTQNEIKWCGAATQSGSGPKFYSKALLGSLEIELGNVVELEANGAYSLGIVQCMFETAKGQKQGQYRVVVYGSETVLGDTASQEEIFMTKDVVTRPLHSVCNHLAVHDLGGGWGSKDRREQFKEYLARRERNSKAAMDGTPLEYICRKLYQPEKGMFSQMPSDLKLGTMIKVPKEEGEQKCLALDDGNGFRKCGIDYRIGDFIYLDSDTWKPLVSDPKPKNVPEYAAKGGRGHKGSNQGIRPFGIGKLVSVGQKRQSTLKKMETVGRIGVQRFYRPEDVNLDLRKSSDYWELFAGPDGTVQVSVDAVVGKCCVVPKGHRKKDDLGVFECTHSVDPMVQGELKPPPAEFDAMETCETTSTASRNAKDLRLRTLDIFAGCGGLSEGLHGAGVSVAKWAIEYDDAAAEAYKKNYGDAAMFCNNSSVILRSAMAQCGYLDDCHACEAAEEQAGKMDEEVARQLPSPGDVDFIVGGPPCQGYSGMNRFNHGQWSMMQNSMVINYLSFADFYRPRFFLLENVRNFVSHNKSRTFRLVLRSLLDMGYQVRFGVLNAGNYGVPQSRKRTFIWGAAPGEKLPDWPAQLHVFQSPTLSIRLPGGIQYTAVPNLNGAPLRAVTVRDAISDLPPIQNGADNEVMEYGGEPISAYQRAIRQDSTQLMDHISKRLNDLNLERCRCIPKHIPGADWRVLQEIVKKDPDREKFKGQPLVPWCLPNTADRHNGWRGLFGRLDLDGHFPTSTTDPQPMGKVGQVFHPEQDRIVSVRECARSQGFPDRFTFFGTVHQKHRQVGNAVPPPLARALGGELLKSLEWKDSQT